MATGSPFMGTLKGKLGETVAMRRNGKQVMRAYISNPKNPNSQKQQVQRMVQATAAQAYSAMKMICDHSFEGVQVGQKSMSYFMSKNMDYLRASINANADGTLLNATADFVKKGVNLPVLNKYIVAKGTLPEVVLADSVADLPSALNVVKVLKLAEYHAGVIEVRLSDFILANNGAVGDWFTFLFMLRENGNVQNGQQVYRFAFVRFVVSPYVSGNVSYLVLNPTLSSSGFVSLQYDEVFSNDDAAGDDVGGLFLNLSSIFNNIGDDSSQLTPVAYAVIHSRQNVGGSWQRSNAEFVIRDNWQALGITYPSDFEGVLDSYAGSAEAKGVGDYVLNGGV